jgi:hypothetical protein
MRQRGVKSLLRFSAFRKPLPLCTPNWPVKRTDTRHAICVDGEAVAAACTRLTHNT